MIPATIGMAGSGWPRGSAVVQGAALNGGHGLEGSDHCLHWHRACQGRAGCGQDLADGLRRVLAFFPQFIHPGQGSQAGQMLVLGAVFWVIGAIWDLGFACASGAIGTWLHRRPRIEAAQPRAEGLTYLGLAAWLP
jgi:hypothetical protein